MQKGNRPFKEQIEQKWQWYEVMKENVAGDTFWLISLERENDEL